MLILPQSDRYELAKILQSIKGKTSRRFRDFMVLKKPEMSNTFCILRDGMNYPAASGGVSQRTWIMDAASGGEPSARRCRVKSPVRIVFSLLFGVGIWLLAR
jgi:hypothetical protein